MRGVGTSRMLDAAMQAESIQIRCNDWRDPNGQMVTIHDAIRHGAWAAHPAKWSYELGGGAYFTVTHVGTGLGLPAQFKSLEDASVVALVLDTYLAEYEAAFAGDMASIDDHGIDDMGSCVWSLIVNLADVPFTVLIVPGPGTSA